MASYTAEDVKKLRKLTGSGMLDCKKALEESNGDFDKAVEILRIKGAKDVGKREERASLEGLLVAKDGAILELNCETDFVAKNKEFQDLANEILDFALANNLFTLGELLAAKINDLSVEDYVKQFSARIGEKLELRRIAKLTGKVASYLHKRSTDLPPSVGALVAYEGDSAEAEAIAKQVAMQVVAMRAKYLTREEVPSDLLETEKRVAMETAKSEGKPDNIVDKIVLGRLNTFYKDIVLLEQPTVADPKKTISDITKANGVTLKEFVRFEVGK